MPIGQYKNWETCIQNVPEHVTDKEAYCGAIKHKVEKATTLLKNITESDVQFIATNIIKQVSEAAKERAEAKGLVPQSGDPNHPERWVKPEHKNTKRKTKKNRV